MPLGGPFITLGTWERGRLNCENYRMQSRADISIRALVMTGAGEGRASPVPTLGSSGRPFISGIPFGWSCCLVSAIMSIGNQAQRVNEEVELGQGRHTQVLYRKQ